MVDIVCGRSITQKREAIFFFFRNRVFKRYTSMVYTIHSTYYLYEILIQTLCE